VAKADGFNRPILHGRCTFGVVMHALRCCVCDGDTTMPRYLALCFFAPVFPRETIRTGLWHQSGGTCSFRARVVERDAVVVNNGLFRVNA
jgi:acyl dehydratase